MSAHVSVTRGAERYGVAVEHVREVTDAGTIVPVPGAPSVLAGIVHLRGEILPVLNLPDLLGAPAGDPRRLVVVGDGDRVAGLPVDSVTAVGDHTGEDMTVLDIPAILDAVGRTR